MKRRDAKSAELWKADARRDRGVVVVWLGLKRH